MFAHGSFPETTTDLVQILPKEISEKIFFFTHPKITLSDLALLRSVSAIWRRFHARFPWHVTLSSFQVTSLTRINIELSAIRAITVDGTLPARAFTNFSALESLSACVPSSEWVSFKLLPKLSTIFLKLESKQPHSCLSALSELPRLTCLGFQNLSSGSFLYFALFQLPHIRKLVLRNIREIGVLENLPVSSTSLTHLSVKNCDVAEEESAAIVKITSLQKLKLSIVDSSLDIMQPLKQLHTLHLNPLGEQDLSPLGALPSLQKLKIFCVSSSNQLAKLFPSCSRLRTLGLMYSLYSNFDIPSSTLAALPTSLVRLQVTDIGFGATNWTPPPNLYELNWCLPARTNGIIPQALLDCQSRVPLCLLRFGSM